MKISDYAQKRYIILNKIVKYSKIKTKFKMKSQQKQAKQKGRGETLMNNIKVQTKMIMVILATMAALVLCTIFSAQSMMELQSRALETMETDERHSYDEQIKQQVDNVFSLCQTIYDQYQEGVYTEAEAKKLAADEIRQLRYGDSGYFWIDQYDGTNVVLLGSATEGTNRMETEDANGYQMVKEIIRVGQEPDSK